MDSEGFEVGDQEHKLLLRPARMQKYNLTETNACHVWKFLGIIG